MTKYYISVYSFNFSTQSSSCVTSSSKDLNCFSSTKFSDYRRLNLEQRNCARQLLFILFSRHAVKIIAALLQVSVRGLHLPNHISQFISYNWVIDQFFSKSFPHVGVFHTLLIAYSCKLSSLHSEVQSLMVEVDYYVLETLPFLTYEILYRNFDIFQNNESCAGAPHSLTFHLSGRDSWHCFFQNHQA